MKFILPLVCILAVASAWEQSDKDAVMNSLPEGMPKLGVFNMKEVTPKLLTTFLKLDGIFKDKDAFEYIGNTEREIINLVTSAANNCEICLSFHCAALAKEFSKEDLALMAQGGIPEGKWKNLVIAAKYANAHKGMYLEREKQHLAELGFTMDNLFEINFVVGQMTSNNMVFASLVNEGAPIEDFLKGIGPFADTVYAKKDL